MNGSEEVVEEGDEEENDGEGEEGVRAKLCEVDMEILR